MNDLPVPDAFPELAPFVDWALEPERARTEKRAVAAMEDICAFYDAMMLRIDEVLDYLEGYFGSDMPPQARRLYLMSLSLVEVTTTVEFYKRQASIHACNPLRFVAHR